MTLHRVEDPYDWSALLLLLQAAFASMGERIDPPSSMKLLTPDAIARQAHAGEVWAIGQPPVACVFLTQKPAALSIGKLAVAASHRRQGLACALIKLAEARARALQLPALELQTRIELLENASIFQSLGFTEVARTAHPGYDRPTSITFRRLLT
jgi:predicted N-acetyltransferase YhbS